jgi:ubiquinone/menaquinone biosynthesis C-methylase UbiE
MTDWAHEYFEHGYAQRWALAAPSDLLRKEADGIRDILQLSPRSPVVDIACGHGKHALALAQRGCTVIGVDFAASLLSRARQLAHQLDADVRWIRGDMRRLPIRDGSADAVLIIDAFGFFETEAEHEAVLREARRILGRSRSLMMKVANGVPILAAFRDTAEEQREGVTVSIARTLTLDPPRMTEQLRISDNRGQGTYERRQRLYRQDELQSLFEHAGLTVTGVFANTDGAPFDPAQSSTIWIVGRRGDAP